MASAPARKIQQITYEKRLEILQKLEKGASIDQLAVEYGVRKRTIQRYRKNATSIRQFSQSSNSLCWKRKPSLLHDVIDTRLYTWLLQKRALGDNLTDNLLQEKAMELYEEFGGPSNFTASNGWLRSFKRRHNIRLVGTHREKADANVLVTEKFKEELKGMLEEEDIDEENVYSMDETSLMWKALPQRILVHEGEQCAEGQKIRKERWVTVAFCANATGTHKLPPLFIHKYAKPRALKHCKHILPVVYKTQRNAWINEAVFNDWYTNHFKPSVRQHQLQQHGMRKVLLILDHCKEHMLSEEAREDSQFKQMFLPPNTTAIFQPMNQGVIAKCKKLFRQKLLNRVLQHGNGIKQFYSDYDIKDCIDFITEAWDAVTVANVQNSWRKLLDRPPSDESPERQDSNIKDLEQLEGRINFDDVIEWIAECEKQESIMTQEDTTDSKVDVAEEDTDCIFDDLLTWAETQPELIKLHVNVLINYYNQK